jgi:hypothetical protein
MLQDKAINHYQVIYRLFCLEFYMGMPEIHLDRPEIPLDKPTINSGRLKIR